MMQICGHKLPAGLCALSTPIYYNVHKKSTQAQVKGKEL